MQKRKPIWKRMSSTPAKMLASGRFPAKVYKDKSKYSRKSKYPRVFD